MPGLTARGESPFYRTYVTKFETSSGEKIYCGMHKSTHINPLSDPYCGSGLILRNAISKYGVSCIKSVEWFEHSTEEEMIEAEILLISSMVDNPNCTNIAYGGFGGNALRYASDERKEAFRETSRQKMIKRYKDSDEIKKHSNRMRVACNRPEERQKRAERHAELYSRPGYSERMSAIQKETQSRPDVKAKNAEGVRAARKAIKFLKQINISDVITIIDGRFVDKFKLADELSTKYDIKIKPKYFENYRPDINSLLG